MSTIGVTGAFGFFGWHLRCRLQAMRPDTRVKAATRETFLREDALESFVSGCDAVVHLAGANRGNEAEIEQTNPTLAQALTSACSRSGATPHLLFPNSTHRNRDTAYGRSKAASAEILRQWAAGAGAPLTDLVFPNLFGEHGRPHYNSAVATFCHELSREEVSRVNPEGLTELLHVQDAAASVLEHIEKRTDGEVIVEGTKLAVPHLYEKLQQFSQGYSGPWFPPIETSLDLQLFNTLRSYLFPGIYPVPLKVHTDQRGAFYEIARGHGQTQASFSTTEPAVTRGEHFHTNRVERFVVLSGQARIEVRQLFHDKIHVFEVDGSTPVAIDMPTLHAHNLTNTGDRTLLTAFWTNDHFDPTRPDTYPEPVGQPSQVP